MPETPKAQIAQAVVTAVAEVASNPQNSLAVQDAAVVAREVTEKIAPSVIHATNNEPWYQSRVTWGAIGAIVLPLAGAIGVTTDMISMDEFVALGIAAGTVASGLFTLYGRYVARKPIGS